MKDFDKSIQIGSGNDISDDVKIHNNVVIGNNNKIYSGTIIYPNTIIGNNNIILNNNILGEYGVDAKDNNFKQKIYRGLIIGNNNYFHVNNIIFSGFYTKTEIGDNNKFLSQVTLHHDNIVHNSVVFYPRAISAGLCRFMDNSTVGMNASIQQRSIIGNYAMIGMGNIASHSIFPFYIYFNNKYQRFNKMKIPSDLQRELDANCEQLELIIKKLKEKDLNNKKEVDLSRLPKNIVSIIEPYIGYLN